MTVQKTIPSYLYLQYKDDAALQAFVDAQNGLTQAFVDWFNDVNLPIYTKLDGPLLDFVGSNLYGMARPVLPFGTSSYVGLLNTFTPNQLPLNTRRVVNPDSFVTDDDTYKRVLTWHFSKIDGKQLSVEWLKRRVVRFLLGTDGANLNPDNTYRISVTFGADYGVTITVVNHVSTLVGSALLGSFALNTIPINSIVLSVIDLEPLAFAAIFKAACDAGVLELPFQFVWTINVS